MASLRAPNPRRTLTVEPDIDPDTGLDTGPDIAPDPISHLWDADADHDPQKPVVR